MMDSIAFKTLERPRSPNTYLVAPEGFCEKAEPDEISSVFEVAPEVMLEAVLEVAADTLGWEIATYKKAQGIAHIISTSRLMRFKDDLHVLVMPADGPSLHKQCRLAIYSSSRVGHSDLGANRKRVKYLLKSLQKKQIRA